MPAALLAGCGGVQSVLDPHGPRAAAIAGIAWVMFIGAALILLLVTVLALLAFYRPRPRPERVSDRTWILAGGIGFPVVTLSALLYYGVHAMNRDLDGGSSHPERIEVVANRWWWDVHYFDSNGHLMTTANEIRIPTGRPVIVELHSRDVIHSFWVPNLAGKMDVIPGRTNRIVLHAAAAGTYRGQCAEYCGAQHARMAFHVIAAAPADHARWLDEQRQPAREPADEVSLRGRQLFQQHCLSCHTVRGIGSAGRPGPDLTHLASRRRIAAGTLENERSNLLAFITDSQALKPGNQMPSHAHLGSDNLRAIASYLEGLH